MTSTIVKDFDLLSQPMQQRIQRRIAQHKGALGPLVAAVQADVDQLDTSAAALSEEGRRGYQAQRALLLAQLAYLAHIREKRSAREEPHPRGFWSRFRRQSTTVTK